MLPWVACWFRGRVSAVRAEEAVGSWSLRIQDMESTPCWRYTLGWLWQWLMRHATVSAQPNLRSQFKTSTQPLNVSPYGPVRPSVLIPGLFYPPSPFPLPLRRFFFLPRNDFAEPYRQSDWFLCLHRPLRRASDNELLLLKWRAWEGWFSCALTTSRALDEKWSLGAYTLKTVSLKNITLWPGIMNDKHLELVSQIHFLMKKIATALLVSETSIHFQTLGQKGRTFGEEPLFFAGISCC